MNRSTIALWIATLLAATSVAAEPARPLVVAGSWSGYANQTDAAKKFSEENDIGVRVIGISNRRGLQFLAERKIDVAVFSPSPKLTLDESLQQHFPDDDARVKKYVVGHFSAVVVVNRLNPVNRLTLEQLNKIYTGKATRWKSGGRIECVGQGADSKSFEIVRQAIMAGPLDSFATDFRTFRDSNGAIDYVAKHADAIGFCTDPQEPITKVKLISVSAGENSRDFSPSPENVLRGHYPLSEPLLLLTIAENGSQADQYCQFACSSETAEFARASLLKPQSVLDELATERRLAQLRRDGGTQVSIAGQRRHKKFVEDLALGFSKAEKPIEIRFRQMDDRSATLDWTHSDEIVLCGNSNSDADHESSGAARSRGLNIARLAVGIVVHPSNTINELLMADLREIYAGNVKSWPGVKKIMTVHGAAGDSDAVTICREKFGPGEPRWKYAAHSSASEIIAEVARDVAAIGLVNLAEFPLGEKSVKLVPVLPPGAEDAVTLANGEVPADYPLATTYTLYVSPSASETARDFVKFLTTARISETLRKHGLVPAAEAK